MRNYWTTPDSLVKVMTAGLPTNQERFARPLDFNPSFGRYCSHFQENSIFGASGDAYSCKWTGSSQAHPEHSPKDMQKAVRWAIGSSLQTAKPSLTTFDVKSGSAYQQWLGHPAVSKIACIPKKGYQVTNARCMADPGAFLEACYGRHAAVHCWQQSRLQHFCQPCTFGTRSAAVHAKSPHDIRIHSAISQQPIANVNTAHSLRRVAAPMIFQILRKGQESIAFPKQYPCQFRV